MMATRQTADPRMTVALITHNHRDELVRTLDMMTSLPERPPVIVVDNGSSDSSAEAPGVTRVSGSSRPGRTWARWAATSPARRYVG